jgi:hypothetical protein
MMADTLPLSGVPVGSTLLLPCRLTAKGAGGVTLETLAADRTTTGSIQVTVAGVVSGAFTTDPRDQPVRVVAFALAIGDVVRKDDTGETLVVQATGLGPSQDRWSPSAAGRPVYDGAGWMRVGHIDLT